MTRALAAAALVVLAFAAYDLVWAAGTRCTLAGHRLRVLALDDLDRLPLPPSFALERPRFSAARRPLRIPAGRDLLVSGRSGDPAGGAGAADAVFIVLDGRIERARYAGGAFAAVVPGRLLARGSHTLAVRVVAADLSGYAEAPVSAALDAEPPQVGPSCARESRRDHVC